ncbi:efflux transporter outer membrane subunit [Piscinibacter sp.]|uniref:efflux transporter outer membrane subunit n=1 Tax=Piscinibacter sp. TaxID=1903157 RepID=UPI002C5AE8CE|nr:efflux transporter outer membrane subunit [Albitalea sp.]HUG23747.1 efflux transporter outer membrane subunit [Albitalea sp.]
MDTGVRRGDGWEWHSGLAVLAVVLLMTACAVPPRAASSAPAMELPAATPLDAGLPVNWWTSFADPQLTALVEEALNNNRDLARAAARIDQSRAALRLARAERQPSVNAAVSTGRQRVSENGSVPLGGVSPIGNDHRATVNVAYEVDLWSRLAREHDAARGELLATAYARDTLRTALAAQVVQSYATLQSLDAQYMLFERAVQAQRESLKLQHLRLDAGDIGELDIRQLEAELITNEAELPKLDRARGEAERALALVLGRTPRAVVEQGVPRATTPASVPTDVALPENLPSDLLQRRPDVQAAEARLQAAGARVDAARAAYFPSISLTAAFGRQSVELSRLTDGPSLIWSVVASLTQPIWNGGRLDAQTDLARARQREAELDYRDTVAVAFKEVRDALGARSETQQSLRNAIERERALSRAAQLTALRFNGGESSRLDLIEAERAALAAQAQMADARRAIAVAQADLYRVLGGGWEAPQGAE